MYATQSPLFASFASLPRQDQFLGAEVITGSNWEEVAASTHEFEFRVGVDAIVPWDSLPRVDEDRMRVITGLFCTGGNALVSDSPSVSLAAYLDTLPPLKEGADALGRAQTGKLRQDERRGFVEEHPFLEHFLTHDAQPTKREGLGGHASFAPPEGGDVDALVDAELEGAFHELHRARAALAAEDVRACHDFQVSRVGGAWLMGAKGRAYDAFPGSARGASANA
jgi:hypothetical protein